MDDDLAATLTREFRDMRAELLADLLRALPAAIAAALNTEKQGAGLKRTDRAALAALLPAIASSRRMQIAFTAAEALAHVQLIPEVVAAIQSAIGAKDAGAARRLGKLLSKSDGVVVDGLFVSRAGEVRDGALWSVARVR